MSFNSVAIAYVKGIAYRIHFCDISKDDAVNKMNGSLLADKRGALYFFLLCTKMSECNWLNKLTYYQRNQDVIPNRAKDYYENWKERLRKQVTDKYKNLPEEEIIKRGNMEKTDTTRLKEYQKKEAKKSQENNEQNSFSIIV